MTSKLISDRGTATSSIGFGRDGEPFYVNGPYDDADSILRQLERTAGRDHYHYLVEV